MPLYDYRCEDCGHEFDQNRPIDQRDEADCPACRSHKTKRVLRSLGFFGGGRRGGSGGNKSSCGPTTRSGFT